MRDASTRERTNDRRVGVLLLLGLVVLFGGLYVAGYLFTSDKIPEGTTVSGVEIGGLTPVAAETVLADELEPRAKEPIVVAADGRRFEIKPERAGLAVDTAASVEQTGAGRSWAPGRMWDYFTGGDDFEAVVTVDEVALDKAVGRVAKEVDTRAKEGRIVFEDGQALPTYPKSGQALESDAAADAILGAFLGDGEVVDLAVAEVEPEVSEDEVRAAMNEFANPAMSAPVIIELRSEQLVLRPDAYAAALGFEAKDGRLVPTLEEKKFMAAIAPAIRKVELAPRDATVQLVDGSPQVVPSRNGVTIDPDKVGDDFLDTLTESGSKRSLTVKGVVDKADFTTAEAEALNIEETVSSFTTYFPHADYRNVNLGRAAELVNGTVLKPGETFSLNDTVGERTAENGFTKGFIIADGVFKEDFGGGVSQVATTLFNAAFFAGLEDVEHKPHSFYIDRYPIGREATVVWGALDLKFKNDTPHGILIQSWVNPSTPSSQGSMNVRMWSTKYWDITAGQSERYNLTKEETRYIQGPDCVENSGYGGFDIDVYRYFRKPGSSEVVRKETMTTTYTPSDTVVCGKPPKNQQD
ncbi:MAG TPA: VanW family protein [Nocardioidaceae bacterium]|nr:VanW family protein [Nocardioidaceae bacterium]